MTFAQKESLCAKLQSLAPPGAERNRAKKYPAFGIFRGDDFVIAVHVGARGATFFTEDTPLLELLAARDIASEPCDQSKQLNRKRYRFPKLTIDQIVGENEDSFRKLVSDSIAIKESGL